MTAKHDTSHGPEVRAIEDREILSRLAQGEVSALAALYERYRLAVLRFVSNATSQAPDTEDIVQSTFMVAARKAKAFDGRKNARPWLFGIAGRLVHRRLRGRARWMRTFEELARRLRGQHHDARRELALRNELAQALAQLSERKRIVLLLAEVEGLTCDEIAEALDIPIGTVWTRLHHARRELRAILEGQES